MVLIPLGAVTVGGINWDDSWLDSGAGDCEMCLLDGLLWHTFAMCLQSNHLTVETNQAVSRALCATCWVGFATILYTGESCVLAGCLVLDQTRADKEWDLTKISTHGCFVASLALHLMMVVARERSCSCNRSSTFSPSTKPSIIWSRMLFEHTLMFLWAHAVTPGSHQITLEMPMKNFCFKQSHYHDYQHTELM